MAKTDIQERTFKFSIRIVKLCKFLRERGGTGYDLSKQLIRSGTSVGANVEESIKITNDELQMTNYYFISGY
jgi:four helix bundle protein